MLVLVTGASGRLGKVLVPRLKARGWEVREASRTTSPPLDLATGAGLEEAMSGVEAVVHAASSPFRNTAGIDVEGTRRLVAEAGRVSVRHLLYPSIVGVHRVPTAYYQAKLAAERIVSEAAVPWTVARITQFHPFVEEMLDMLSWSPILPLDPWARLQPVDLGEAADHLVRVLGDVPQGRAADLGGPEVHTLPELASAWKAARGIRRLSMAIPWPGAAARAQREGALCLAEGPACVRGKRTFAEYLAKDVRAKLG